MGFLILSRQIVDSREYLGQSSKVIGRAPPDSGTRRSASLA